MISAEEARKMSLDKARIEEIWFSKEYMDFRIRQGSNGQRDLIINNIKTMYDVK